MAPPALSPPRPHNVHQALCGTGEPVQATEDVVSPVVDDVYDLLLPTDLDGPDLLNDERRRAAPDRPEDHVAADRERGGPPGIPCDRPLEEPHAGRGDFKRARLVLDEGPGAFDDGARHRFEVEHELPAGEPERHRAL